MSAVWFQNLWLSRSRLSMSDACVTTKNSFSYLGIVSGLNLRDG